MSAQLGLFAAPAPPAAPPPAPRPRPELHRIRGQELAGPSAREQAEAYARRWHGLTLRAWVHGV